MNPGTTRSLSGAPRAAEPLRRRAKRMPAEARKEVILKEASEFFARHGFAASTRDLADRIGVRQALLYKYFPSKEALIDAIFDRVIRERTEGARGVLDNDASSPLADRILSFYDGMAALAEGSGVRLSSRAALEDLPLSARLSAFLTEMLFKPVIGELRALEKLPDFKARPFMVGEFEIMMAMHSSAMFFNLRRDLTHLPLPDDPAPFMRQNVAVFIEGARRGLVALHADGSPSELTAAAAAGALAS
jgi:AcrR family transcriptional regulator